MKHAGLFVLTLMVALALLVLPAPSPAAAQTDQGRIVFVSNRDGNEEIYVMNADGSGVTRLTNNPARDTDPAWSPDGAKIAFSSDRDGLSNIYVMNADGAGVTRLATTNDASDPTWSPDGTRILFSLFKTIQTADGQDSFRQALFVMGADGSNLTELNTVVELSPGLPYHYLYAPDWSPDGARVTFVGTFSRTLLPELFVAQADGSQMTTLGAVSFDPAPTWSPDSTRVLFTGAYAPNGVPDIYAGESISTLGIWNPDSSDVVWISNTDTGSAPTWSPDGTRIAFVMSNGSSGTNSIYTIRPDGSELVRLTDGLGDTDPDWGRTASAPAPTPIPPAADALLFPETGYSIAGRIRSYWEQNGGLPVFGYPITAQQEELIEGQPVQAQWFERNRLELHPENAPPYDVLLGRLGADRLAQQGYDWQAVPAEAPQADCRFFAETGRNVCGDILAAWRANGLDLDGQRGFSENENLALFGLPLTGLITMTTPDGSERQVQYFERARFELHPENAPPFNVLLGLLGNEVWGGQ